LCTGTLSLNIMIHNSPACSRKEFIRVPYFHMGHSSHSNLPKGLFGSLELNQISEITFLEIELARIESSGIQFNSNFLVWPYSILSSVSLVATTINLVE
jgi:hypothetical protein